VLDEITKKEIPKVPENQNVQQQEQHVPQTPTSVFRRYIKLSRPPERYSPSLYEVKGKENLVCRLKKRLYGLKKSPRKWYLKFDKFMIEQGYNRCHYDHCVFFKSLENGSYIILLLYVDDMLVASSNIQNINVLKNKLVNSFAMKDLGATKKILGMRITRDIKNHKLTLSQGEYIEKVLVRFRMQNEKPVNTLLENHFKLTKKMCPKTHEEIDYMSRVPFSSAFGSLMYAMVFTRPDIAHAVGVVRRYMNNPGKEHWEVVKWILRYLRGIVTHTLCFGGLDTVLQG
jgi:hypothetical protein